MSWDGVLNFEPLKNRREKAGEAHSGANEMFGKAEDLLAFGSWYCEPSNDEWHWSRGMYSLLQYRFDFLEKPSLRLFLDYVVESDRQHVSDNFDRVLHDIIAVEFEHGMVTTQGLYLTVITKIKPVSDIHGKVLQLFGITCDITRARRKNDADASTIQKLSVSNQDLEEFAYVASHDLQEPLRKISIFNSRLQEKYADILGPEGAKYLSRIEAAAGSMQSLIEDILCFSIVDARARPAETCDLNRIIAHITKNDYDLKIEESGSEIDVEPLPAVRGDFMQFRQLFINLLSNAIKFRKPGKPAQINIYTEPLTDRDRELIKTKDAPKITFVRVVVRDSGIGFSPADAERIFDVFHRLHGKYEYSGSGIGLAICKKIMAGCGGFIYAQSTPQIGSEFILLFPTA